MTEASVSKSETTNDAEPSARLRRWLRRLAKAGLVLLLMLVIGLGVAWRWLNQADAQHARFLEAGKTINAFLKEYSHALTDAYQSQDRSHLLECYAANYESPGRGEWQFTETEDLGDSQYSTLAATGEADFDRSMLDAEVADYLQQLTSVHRVKCKINLIEDIVPGQEATLTVKYILDGVDKDGLKLQDRFFFRWKLVHTGATDPLERQWKIVSDELVEGVRVAGTGDRLERMDLATLGIDFVHARDPKLDVSKSDVNVRFGVIQHAPGGVTAVDYDKDGHVDLFFPDGVRSRLYRHDGAAGKLHFTDVTSSANLDGIDQATCGVFFDVDSDGDLDLFVGRYYAPCRLYINDGRGRFSDRAAEYGLDVSVPCMSACVLDYDQTDPHLDLYLGVNGNSFRNAPNIPFYATNAEPNRLFRNVGGRQFVDVTDEAGVGTTGWTLAVAAGDFNDDGRVDLVSANDFGRKVLYRNNGNGTFTDIAKEAGVLDFSGGMGVAFGDVNDDGALDLYFANINSNQRWFGEEQTIDQYNRNLIRSKWIAEDFGHYKELYGLVGDDWRGLGQQIGEGNSLFINNRDETFQELKDCHATRAGWSWSVALFDMDNDADLDIYACNGWISGKKKDDL